MRHNSSEMFEVSFTINRPTAEMCPNFINFEEIRFVQIYNKSLFNKAIISNS